MSNKNIASDLMLELSTQEQENLSGGQYFPPYPYPYQPWPKKRRRGGINVRVINKPIIVVGGGQKKGGYGGDYGGYGGDYGGYGGYGGDGGYGGYGGDGGYGGGYGGYGG